MNQLASHIPSENELELRVIADYKKNPCGTLSIPYWKSKKTVIPDSIKIVHHKDYSESYLNGYNDEMYFRLSHSLADIELPVLAKRYSIKTLDSAQAINILVKHINDCYDDISVTDEVLVQQLSDSFYLAGLQIGIYETFTDQVIATGVAAFDAETSEGSLEWIQVSPEYRGQGFGQAIVNELLLRLKSKASFVTVSGKINNKTNPEALYRKCGFVGNDIWHILRKR